MSNSAINYVLFVFVKSENVNNKLPGKSKGRKKNKIIYFIVRVSKSWNSSGNVIVLYAASKLSFGRSTNPENDKKKKETNKNPTFNKLNLYFLSLDC